MKIFKLFFLGLMLGLSVGECAHAASAAEEEKKESAAQAFDPDIENKALEEWIARSRVLRKRKEPTEWPAELTTKIKQHAFAWQPFNGESKIVSVDVEKFFISQDGSTMIFVKRSGENQLLEVWDTANLRQPRFVHVYHGKIWNIIFSPDKHYALLSDDEYKAALLNLTNSKIPLIDLGTAQQGTFLQNGRRLALKDNFIVNIWNMENLDTMEKYIRNVLMFSHSGNTLAVATERGLEIYDMNNLLQEPRILEGDYVEVVFSPDGQFLAGVDKRNLKLWQTGKLDEEPRSLGDVRHITFSPNSNFLLACAVGGNQIYLWDLQKVEGEPRTFDVMGTGLFKSFFSPNSTFFIMNNDVHEAEGLQLRSVANSEKKLKQFLGYIPDNRYVKVSPDERYMVIVFEGQETELWDLDDLNKGPIAYLGSIGHDFRHFSTDIVAFSPDSRFIMTFDMGDNSPVKVWNIAKLKQRFVVEQREREEQEEKEREEKEREEKQRQEERRFHEDFMQRSWVPSAWRRGSFFQHLSEFNDELIDQIPQEF